MNQRKKEKKGEERSVPRTHGDEPRERELIDHGAEVFPVPTGMNRLIVKGAAGLKGVPRTHGDEPNTPVDKYKVNGCSPYPRG